MNRSYYAAPIKVFVKEHWQKIFGALADHYEFELEDQQKLAWKVQIDLLKQVLGNIRGYVFFEFSIPRMGKRVDVVILANGIIFVVEFKVGEKTYPAYALEQVMDYALDLKNFHETSHNLPIVPILVSTEAVVIPYHLKSYPDNVYEPLKVNSKTLEDGIKICLQKIALIQIDPLVWESGQYKPTPTIIEAARALYRGHSVKDISRNDAGAINLSETSDTIDLIIDQTK